MPDRNAARLKEIVNDSRPARAPIVGIPVALESGQLTCIRVRRDLLKSALTHAEVAYWDEKSNRLVLNGGKRSCWKLISMDRYETHAALDAWARNQRNRAIQKTATPGDRKAAQIEKQIGILQRRRKKLHASRPVNPICVAPREFNSSDWMREKELAWHNGKRTRKELSRVFTGPALKSIGFVSRPDWKTLYAKAATALGIESISDCDRHARITRLTRGPSLNEYLREAPKHLAHMEKPYRPSKPWGNEKPLNVEMREYRMRFLEEVSTIRALDAQIENLREVQRAIKESIAA